MDKFGIRIVKLIQCKNNFGSKLEIWPRLSDELSKSETTFVDVRYSIAITAISVANL